MGTEQLSWTDNEANNGKVGFKSGGTSKEKKLRIAVIVLAVLGAILLIALIVLVTLGVTRAPKTCTSANCVKTASYLLDSLNLSVDPCDNFYQFSCGNWIAAHQEGYGTDLFSLRAEESMKAVASYVKKELHKTDLPRSISKVMKAYDICLQYNGIDVERLKWIFRHVNGTTGWPMVLKHWKEGREKWTTLYVKHFNTYAITTIIDVGIMQNFSNSAENVISISQPDTSTLKDYDFSTVIEFIRTVSNQVNETLDDDIEIMKDLHQYMINISQPHEELLEEDGEMMSVTIRELERIIPSVNWVQFLKECFQGYMKSTNFITSNTKILLLGKSFIQKIIEDLDNGVISKRSFVNYGASRFVNNLLKYYPSEVGESELKARRRRRSKVMNLKDERWKECLSYLFEVAGPAIDYIHMKHREENLIDESMIDYMFSAMQEMVKKATWLDKPTKAAVQEKLKEMTRLTGFPSSAGDVNQLEDIFKDLPEITDNVFDNKLNLDKFVYAQNVAELFTKVNRKEWPKGVDFTTSEVNAYYAPSMNMIVIPAAIQILPYFSANRPAYMNFGGMGLVFGHEITHGLDKDGSKRDKYGNMRNWWTESSKAEFDKRAKCFIDQYNSYYYDGLDSHVDGVQTLSENIADNGGVRQALLAYQKWEKDHGKENLLPGLEQFSAYQLLFISFASSWCSSYHPPEVLRLMHANDEHSAAKFRVLGSLTNMKEFADIFKCKAGSPMNPEHKCVIW